MKSVTFSDIERVPEQARRPSPLRSPQRVTLLVLTLALGLPALMFIFQQIDPGAPLAYIVVPVLAGGLLPMMSMMPGRFEVTTRFDACHLVVTLDARWAVSATRRPNACPAPCATAHAAARRSP